MRKTFCYIQTKSLTSQSNSCCDSYRIQTCNLLIRSQMLYSVELRSLSLFCDCECKVKSFSRTHKIFGKILSNIFYAQVQRAG